MCQLVKVKIKVTKFTHLTGFTLNVVEAIRPFGTQVTWQAL